MKSEVGQQMSVCGTRALLLAVAGFAVLLLAEPTNAEERNKPFTPLLVPSGVTLEAVPYLDVALGVSRFQPDAGAQSLVDTLLGLSAPSHLADADLAVSALSIDLVLRPPRLTSTEWPKGQLQPYLAVGPQAIITTEADDVTKFAIPRNHPPDLTTSLAVKIGTGVVLRFDENFILFGEYRLRHPTPERDARSVGEGARPETDTETYQLIGGFSFRF